jgi:hypothetical protein
VRGLAYYVGRGDAGLAINHECNNCLIDSMRQCLGIQHVDRVAVRNDLVNEFQHHSGRAYVQWDSMLDVESHWRAILCSILKHNSSGLHTVCDLQQYCDVALSSNNLDHGDVLGTRDARYTLVMMIESDLHFDPACAYKNRRQFRCHCFCQHRMQLPIGGAPKVVREAHVGLSCHSLCECARWTIKTIHRLVLE